MEGGGGGRWIAARFGSRPPRARRGSRDAPFHSPTADIASPFQNISFPNASSSRWITNLSITSLSLSFPGEESRIAIRPSVGVSSLFKISQRTLLLFLLFLSFLFFFSVKSSELVEFPPRKTTSDQQNAR